MNVLDKMPAWLRHLLLIVASAALTVISQGIAAGGVDHIVWKDVLNAAVGAGVLFLVLLITPLTAQYGVGKAVAPDPAANGQPVPPPAG